MTGTGWTQHFIGGGSGNDPFWVGFVFGADAVTGLNSTIGAELQMTGTLVNIPANAVEYFMLDGSFESRLVLQVEAVPEPRGWILLVSVLAPILLSPLGARLCRKPRLYH